MTDTATRELDWYLRDHLFRQSNSGKTAFMRESLPSDMVKLYLRYRNANLQQLTETMIGVIEGLVARQVLTQEGNELNMPGKLARLQCGKCFYINYLAESEPRMCLRCQNGELHDFQNKKA